MDKTVARSRKQFPGLDNVLGPQIWQLLGPNSYHEQGPKNVARFNKLPGLGSCCAPELATVEPKSRQVRNPNKLPGPGGLLAGMAVWVRGSKNRRVPRQMRGNLATFFGTKPGNCWAPKLAGPEENLPGNLATFLATRQLPEQKQLRGAEKCCQVSLQLSFLASKPGKFRARKVAR